MTEREARAVLARHGRFETQLTVGEGYMNQVWMGARTVVRLSSGLLHDAMRHEFGVLAALPPSLPHPRPVGHGPRTTTGEYLVMDRVPGDRLDQAWPDLTERQRRRVGHEVGRALAAMHRLPPRRWMVNPFLTAAFTGKWAGAIYAPPHLLPQLLESARTVRPEPAALWDAVAAWGARRQELFADDTVRFTHCDLHARNIMVRGGELAALLDFEGSRLSAPEDEVFPMRRELVGSELEPFLGYVAEGYPELFGHPQHDERIRVRELMWLLFRMHHWAPGEDEDPVVRLTEIVGGP